jgi:hypothetical protein
VEINDTVIVIYNIKLDLKKYFEICRWIEVALNRVQWQEGGVGVVSKYVEPSDSTARV